MFCDLLAGKPKSNGFIVDPIHTQKFEIYLTFPPKVDKKNN